ncbi:hypothetical protein BC828DRAFT_381151 [Blastocladiella britannica]|nr:hypothetical protein BC828DRAFT_381151 [Blastocladiella britannica]
MHLPYSRARLTPDHFFVRIYVARGALTVMPIPVSFDALYLHIIIFAMMSRQKIVVTGSSGLLGRAVLAEVDSRSTFDAVGTAFSRASDKVVKLDLTDKDAVTAFLDRIRPNAIIHCAAERRPDVAETDPEALVAINVHTTAHLATECAKRDVLLVYISTDYVFDGAKPIDSVYVPGDVTNPLNAYGKSKRDGEVAVVDAFAAHPSAKYAILRIPVLYGGELHRGESAVSVLLDGLAAAQVPGSPKAKVDNVSIRYPTHTGDVARVLGDIAQLALVGDGQGAPYLLRETLQFSGQEKWTKYQMTVLFAKALALSMDNVEPVNHLDPNPSTPRPNHIRLDSSRLMHLAIEISYWSFEKYWTETLTKGGLLPTK